MLLYTYIAYMVHFFFFHKKEYIYTHIYIPKVTSWTISVLFICIILGTDFYVNVNSF